MGTKNHPGEFDCYARADPDEPIFTLRAHDPHAPSLIWLWATLREIKCPEQAEKIAEARECATAMIEWAHAHGIKVDGLGVATLAGCMELMRTANTALQQLRGKDPQNTPTTAEAIREFLCRVELDLDK